MGTKFETMLQHGGTFKIWCHVKEASHKELCIEWIHLYIAKEQTLLETEDTSWLSHAGGRKNGRGECWGARNYFFRGNKKSKIGCGDGYPALWMYHMPTVDFVREWSGMWIIHNKAFKNAMAEPNSGRKQWSIVSKFHSLNAVTDTAIYSNPSRRQIG